jgi:hypothetical protein
VLGACLLAIPPAVGPDVEHRAVVLTAAADLVDLMSPIDAVVGGFGGESALPLASVIDALTSGGSAVGGVLTDELPDASSLLSMAADATQADPLGDFLTTILFGGLLLFGGIVASVGGCFQTAWEWLAGIFGCDPYPGAAEASGIGLPDIDAAGAIDPALSTELGTSLGDITALLDPTAIADPGAMFDGVGMEAGIADIGALVSSLIS